ncbi:MAG: NfeD family protein [Clostridia bacterium]|nr:NfeD family protein [Clostridia bacterium]
MGYSWIAWLVVLVLSIIVEGATLALVSVWFMPASIVALVLALCNVPLWVQIVAFIVVSVGTLSFLRPVFKKMLKLKTVPTNSDALIGQKGIVVENIDNIAATGAVKIDGQVWSARSAEGENIAEGEVVTVSSIEGVKLICTK